MKINAKKIKKGSLFKLILVSMVVPTGLFFLLCGLASVFGSETVKWNNEPVTGINGLFAAIAMYPFFVVILTAILWVGAAIGLWAYSWFKNLELEFVEGKVISSSDD